MHAHLLKQFNEKIKAVSTIADSIPGVIIIHELATRSVVFMSEKGMKRLKTTPLELKRLGPEYFNRFFNPKAAPIYVEQIIKWLEQNQEGTEEEITFFQQVRPDSFSPYEWYLSSTRVFFRDETYNPLYLITNAQPIHQLNHLNAKVERLLHEETFALDHQQKFERLSLRERKVLQLMGHGKSAAETASDLGIAVGTVITHKKNIKRKLEISRTTQFVDFVYAFGLNETNDKEPVKTKKLKKA